MKTITPVLAVLTGLLLLGTSGCADDRHEDDVDATRSAVLADVGGDRPALPDVSGLDVQPQRFADAMTRARPGTGADTVDPTGLRAPSSATQGQAGATPSSDIPVLISGRMEGDRLDAFLHGPDGEVIGAQGFNEELGLWWVDAGGTPDDYGDEGRQVHEAGQLRVVSMEKPAEGSVRLRFASAHRSATATVGDEGVTWALVPQAGETAPERVRYHLDIERAIGGQVSVPAGTPDLDGEGGVVRAWDAVSRDLYVPVDNGLAWIHRLDEAPAIADSEELVIGGVVELPAGWELVVDEFPLEVGETSETLGSIAIVGSDGTPTGLRFSRPLVWDASSSREQAMSRRAAADERFRWRVERLDDVRSRVSLVVAGSWLVDKDRVWPVDLDPSFQWTNTAVTAVHGSWQEPFNMFVNRARTQYFILASHMGIPYGSVISGLAWYNTTNDPDGWTTTEPMTRVNSYAYLRDVGTQIEFPYTGNFVPVCSGGTCYDSMVVPWQTMGTQLWGGTAGRWHGASPFSILPGWLGESNSPSSFQNTVTNGSTDYFHRGNNLQVTAGHNAGTNYDGWPPSWFYNFEFRWCPSGTWCEAFRAVNGSLPSEAWDWPSYPRTRVFYHDPQPLPVNTTLGDSLAAGRHFLNLYETTIPTNCPSTVTLGGDCGSLRTWVHDNGLNVVGGPFTGCGPHALGDNLAGQIRRLRVDVNGRNSAANYSIRVAHAEPVTVTPTIASDPTANTTTSSIVWTWNTPPNTAEFGFRHNSGTWLDKAMTAFHTVSGLGVNTCHAGQSRARGDCGGWSTSANLQNATRQRNPVAADFNASANAGNVRVDFTGAPIPGLGDATTCRATGNQTRIEVQARNCGATTWINPSTSTQTVFDFGGVPATCVDVRVRYFNRLDVPTGWITFPGLQFAPADPPIVIANGTSTTSVEWQWTPVAGAATYQLRVNGGSWDSMGAATTHNRTGLSENTCYTGDVRGVSSGGAPGPYGTAAAATFSRVLTPAPAQDTSGGDFGVTTNGAGASFTITVTNPPNNLNTSVSCESPANDTGLVLRATPCQLRPETSPTTSQTAWVKNTTHTVNTNGHHCWDIQTRTRNQDGIPSAWSAPLRWLAPQMPAPDPLVVADATLDSLTWRVTDRSIFETGFRIMTAAGASGTSRCIVASSTVSGTGTTYTCTETITLSGNQFYGNWPLVRTALAYINASTMTEVRGAATGQVTGYTLVRTPSICGCQGTTCETSVGQCPQWATSEDLILTGLDCTGGTCTLEGVLGAPRNNALTGRTGATLRRIGGPSGTATLTENNCLGGGCPNGSASVNDRGYGDVIEGFLGCEVRYWDGRTQGTFADTGLEIGQTYIYELTYHNADGRPSTSTTFRFTPGCTFGSGLGVCADAVQVPIDFENYCGGDVPVLDGCDAPGDGIERCDSLDWDCDGDPLSVGFEHIGDACGECDTGTWVCLPDGTAGCEGATDSTPGETCGDCADSYWACDSGGGAIECIEPTVPGTDCTVPGALGICAEGEIVCTASDITCEPINVPRPEGELCDHTDWDCDGDPFNDTRTSRIRITGLAAGGFGDIPGFPATIEALQAGEPRTFNFNTDCDVTDGSEPCSAVRFEITNEGTDTIPAGALVSLEGARPSMANQTGLLGEYFNGTNFSELLVSRIDSQIDFNWGSGAPHPDVPNNQFSVRWRGTINIPAPGEWTFLATTDDGVRLVINGMPVITRWQNQTATTRTGTITLPAGTHDITMFYYDDTGQASARLEWQGPGTPRAVIPASAFRAHPARMQTNLLRLSEGLAQGQTRTFTLCWQQATALYGANARIVLEDPRPDQTDGLACLGTWRPNSLDSQPRTNVNLPPCGNERCDGYDNNANGEVNEWPEACGNRVDLECLDVPSASCSQDSDCPDANMRCNPDLGYCFICAAVATEADDCTVHGCPTDHRCDIPSGLCIPGCANDDACDLEEICLNGQCSPLPGLDSDSDATPSPAAAPSGADTRGASGCATSPGAPTTPVAALLLLGLALLRRRASRARHAD